MTEITEKNFRKISRNFKGLIELTKKMSQNDLTKLFFEMCDFGLNGYIESEQKRYPNKSIKEIIIDMHNFHEKLKKKSKKLWK